MPPWVCPTRVTVLYKGRLVSVVDKVLTASKLKTTSAGCACQAGAWYLGNR